MSDRNQPGDVPGQDQVRALYEQAESATASAFDEFVSKPGFGALLARSAENVAALSRIGADMADLVLRNLRVAGRADITRLAGQLHRTEDKLERVLQEVEQLRDEVGATAGAKGESGAATTGPRRRSGRSSGSSNGSSAKRRTQSRSS